MAIQSQSFYLNALAVKRFNVKLDFFFQQRSFRGKNLVMAIEFRSIGKR